MSTTIDEVLSFVGKRAVIWNKTIRCSGLVVFPVFGRLKISVTIFVWSDVSSHFDEMTFIRFSDFARVSGLEDFEDDRAAVTSLPGRMDDRSYGNPESKSDVTANQHKYQTADTRGRDIQSRATSGDLNNIFSEVGKIFVESVSISTNSL